jgi:hypothetical protein
MQLLIITIRHFKKLTLVKILSQSTLNWSTFYTQWIRFELNQHKRHLFLTQWLHLGLNQH